MKIVYTTFLLFFSFFALAQSTPVLVEDINPGEGSSHTGKPGVVMGGRFFFVAQTDNFGEEIWVSDGTATGTRMLKDLVPGEDGSSPESLTVVGDLLYFVAEVPATGRELYKSDGTERGTVLIRDIFAGESSAILPDRDRSFGQLDDTLFFAARSSIVDTELWRTDGTVAGTWQVKDIELPSNNTRGSLPRNFFSGDNLVYFTAESGTDNRQIWRTDGSETKTERVSNFNGASGIELEGMIVKNDTAFFGARTFFTSFDFYHIAPTATEPFRIINFPGPGMDVTTDDGMRNRFAVVNDQLLFPADIGNGPDLYLSDGTEAGTRVLLDNNEVTMPPYAPQNFRVVDGVLFYSDRIPDTGAELWKSDGTEAGTEMVRDVQPGGSGSIEPVTYFHAHNDKLYFAASGRDGGNNPTGVEIFTSDGTGNGTELIANLAPGEADAHPSHFTSIGDFIYFFADDGITGRELYVMEAKEPQAALMARVIETTPVSCHGGNDGGVVYTVSGGSSETDGTAGEQRLTRLTAGEKTIIVRDNSGNSLPLTFTITEPTPLLVTGAATPQTNEVGGTISIMASGATPPYSFRWSGSNNMNRNRTDLAFGDYTVTVTDANDCEVIRAFTVIDSTEDLTSVLTLTEAEVTLQPTLVTNTLTVQTAGQAIVGFELVSAAGQLVRRANNLSTETLRLGPVDLAFSPGAYFIRLTLRDGTKVIGKFIRR